MWEMTYNRESQPTYKQISTSKRHNRKWWNHLAIFYIKRLRKEQAVQGTRDFLPFVQNSLNCRSNYTHYLGE